MAIGVTGCPLTLMSPVTSPIVFLPARMSRSVVLPAPEGPRIAKSPGTPLCCLIAMPDTFSRIEMCVLSPAEDDCRFRIVFEILTQTRHVIASSSSLAASAPIPSDSRSSSSSIIGVAKSLLAMLVTSLYLRRCQSGKGKPTERSPPPSLPLSSSATLSSVSVCSLLWWACFALVQGQMLTCAQTFVVHFFIRCLPLNFRNR
mmetsp:Transcript_6584/g.16065  ORF Transcript_6584/g.16065 Transcript_6584/m.16065 type:complete len:202 (-) Transcript_6584:73-678(-)